MNVGVIGCGNIAETYFRAQDYFNNIADKVNKCKDKKANEGISKRAIFKFMDICDSF